MSVQAALSVRPDMVDRPDARPADTRPPPSLWDQATAAGRVEADRVEDVQAMRRAQAYTPLIEALEERGVPRRRMVIAPWDPFGIASERAGVYDYDTIWREAQRAGISGLPADQQAFERQAYRRGGERDTDLQTLQRGGGFAGTVAQFTGGMIGSLTDPINLYTLPLGGGGKHWATRILSEGAMNAGIEVAQFPVNQRAYGRLGENYGMSEVAQDAGLAFAAGAAFRGAVEVAPAAGRAVARVDAAGYRAAAPLRERLDNFYAARDLARAFADQVPENLRTPDQVAALRILQRDAAIEATSPYVRTHQGSEAHRTHLARAAETLASGRGAPKFDLTHYMQASRGAESNGDDLAAAATSSAYGRYQFLKETWLEYYGRTFGQTGESREQILAKRANGTVQDRVMATFTNANAEALRRAGVPVTNGTVYLAHFLGRNDAIKVLRAAEDAPVAGLIDGDSIAANQAVFAPRGRPPVSSASELVAWAESKMGNADVRAVPASVNDAWAVIDGSGGEVPPIRPAALDAERPIVTIAGGQVPSMQFRPADIEVDAELMQFKSGGDQFGVTDRLQGVQEWDGMAAGAVTVWESLGGRRLIADGYQRLALARRAEANGAEVTLTALVLREADGYSALDARILTALKNVAEGTGTAVDAAKVFRDAPLHYNDMIDRRLPPRSALVRDGKALARLSDEAFGAVINEVLPEGHAAAIGHLAPDARTHMALVELLAAADPPNRRQAEAIVRQALDAGFVTETQEELFGTRDLVRGLFAQKARLLDKTLGELRRLKGAFGVAARNADVLDAAGNRIDVGASEAAAAANARALALVDRLALRKGNAVNDLLDAAARRLANGEPISRVTRDLVRSIRDLDLALLEREGRASDDVGAGAGGSGRGGEPASEAGDGSALDGPSAADIDALEAEADLGPGLFDDPAFSRAFDDDAGDGVKAAADNDWHDIRQMKAVHDDSIGPFGPVFEDVDPGDWNAVVARLTNAGTGEVRAVLHHPKIGLIDVVWGKEGTGKSDGYGLAKILRFHSEVIADLPAILRNMDVAENVNGRVRLESPDHEAAVSLDWHGEQKAWLLTAYARREKPSPATDDARAAGAKARAGSFPALEGTPKIGDKAAANNPSAPTYDLDDGKGPRTAADIEAEIAADQAALDALRNCLK